MGESRRKGVIQSKDTGKELYRLLYMLVTGFEAYEQAGYGIGVQVTALYGVNQRLV